MCLFAFDAKFSTKNPSGHIYYIKLMVHIPFKALRIDTENNTDLQDKIFLLLGSVEIASITFEKCV